MSSYIDRDPIVKFLTEKINDTETTTMLGRGYKMGLQFAKAAMELADELPTCRECEMWDDSYEVIGEGKRCLNFMIVTKPDFYCGWGRKSE